MSIEKIEVHIIKCDGCGTIYERDELSRCFPTEVEAKNEIGEQPYRCWEEIDGKHYCPDCFEYDEDTEEVKVKVNNIQK